MDLKMSRKQKLFIDATADEVLFGGAAGGGKSYGQLIDALLYALKYPRSKQLILRRTFPELDKSLIRVSLGLYPGEIYRYNSSSHTGKFINGSLLDFAYCDNENDVYKYQSAEYDVIRFDELTHFTESMYTYLISRLRGANDYPKQMKSSTNPGGVGHYWVKKRFIDSGTPNQVQQYEEGSRIFIPSMVQDNQFLLKKDSKYLSRLKNLSETDQKALLYGDWDIFEGQYFTMWDRNVHVVRPYQIPEQFRRYVTLDYGRDMLAAYFIAVDTAGRAVVYKEIYQSGLIVSDAAQAIQAVQNETVSAYYAPPDLWNKHADTGRSTAEIFAECGINLVKANNNRVQGWLDLCEWLKVDQDEQDQPIARLRVFESCQNLIRTLPALQFDARNPNDTANEPHELTHAPDALRYFVAGRPLPSSVPVEKPEGYRSYEEQVDDFLNFGG